ncbi:trigger factor [Dethiosulfatibacter aminovorans DSM 17477]|uniref:Trigger factor n=1 Tax=Dethiosulfatibacter aminovorans DSM 17477 TaxID=1121476 RepID=A0A1M6KWQ4_9FIRM|nr:trigger factor [Dethiosulfatibacter aminovorans]SHJ63391.1 trigger factor [Dethiosulfatibacter aminovorans DSM 17477]
MAKVVGKEKNVVSIEFEISQPEFQKGIEKAYKKMRGRINIPGFRKGKAPRKIIEMNYGKEVFYQDAIDIALPDAYEAAIKELEINPINRPSIDIKEMEEGKDVLVAADIEVMPEVTLADVASVEVEKIEYTVTDEDVDNEMKRMQEQNARIITVEDRAIENGDTAVIDYAGFKGEEQFEGGTADNHSLEIGSGSFIPGFEDQLIGKNAGEEVEVNVTFPEEYHSEELAGQPVVFKVKINEIKAKELPELDDEFAKDISEFDTFEEMKSDAKANMIKRAEDSEKVAIQNAAVNAFTEASETLVPDILVENEIDYQIRNFEQQMSMQGINMQDYYKMIGSDMSDLRDNIRPQAEVSAKTELVIGELIKQQNFEVSDEEVNEELENLAKQYKIEDEEKINEFKENLKAQSTDYINDTIQRRKAMEYLVANVKFVEKKEESEEAEEDSEK